MSNTNSIHNLDLQSKFSPSLCSGKRKSQEWDWSQYWKLSTIGINPKHKEKFHMGPVPLKTKKYNWDQSQMHENITNGISPIYDENKPMGPVP